MKGSVFLDKLSYKLNHRQETLFLSQQAGSLTVIYTMLTFQSHSKKLQRSEHTMMLKTPSPSVTLGHPLLSTCFTQLLLTAQSCCHQHSPGTGLPLQQQDLWALWFLSIFSNKGYKPRLKSEIHHASDVLYFSRMQPVTLPAPKGSFQLSFIYWIKGGAQMTQLQANTKEKINP